jgi:hypothetical protein
MLLIKIGTSFVVNIIIIMKQFASNHQTDITRLRIPIFIFHFKQKLFPFLQNLYHVKACEILIKPALNYGLCQQDGFHSTKPGRSEDESSIVLWNIGTHLHKMSQPTGSYSMNLHCCGNLKSYTVTVTDGFTEYLIHGQPYCSKLPIPLQRIILWHMRTCRLVEIQHHFRAIHYLLPQGWGVSQAHASSLQIEMVSSSGTLVKFYQTIWRHIPYDGTHQSHCCENLNFQITTIYFTYRATRQASYSTQNGMTFWITVFFDR